MQPRTTTIDATRPWCPVPRHRGRTATATALLACLLWPTLGPAAAQPKPLGKSSRVEDTPWSSCSWPVARPRGGPSLARSDHVWPQRLRHHIVPTSISRHSTLALDGRRRCAGARLVARAATLDAFEGLPLGRARLPRVAPGRQLWHERRASRALAVPRPAPWRGGPSRWGPGEQGMSAPRACCFAGRLPDVRLAGVKPASAAGKTSAATRRPSLGQPRCVAQPSDGNTSSFVTGTVVDSFTDPADKKISSTAGQHSGPHRHPGLLTGSCCRARPFAPASLNR